MGLDFDFSGMAAFWATDSEEEEEEGEPEEVDSWRRICCQIFRRENGGKR